MSKAVESATTIQGELQRQGQVATGWCWSPDQPNRRLIVELLVGGRVVAATVAARLRLDLVRNGVCDGYHAFTLVLPRASDLNQMVEARERSSGIVFGRLLGPVLPEIADWSARCDALSGTVGLLRGRLPSRGHHPLPPSSAAGHTDGLRLPEHPAPKASLLLDAVGAGAACMALITRMAPLLANTGAEVVAADNGRGPHSASLASLPGLRLAVGEGDEAVRFNAAARAARAPVLVLLDPLGFSAPGLAALLQHASGAPGPLAGPPILSAAARAGLPPIARTTPGKALRTGLVLLLAAERFADMGGLDASLEDGAGLPLLDLVLRLALAGDTVTRWPEPSWGGRQPGPGAAVARQRFAAMWRSRSSTPASTPFGIAK